MVSSIPGPNSQSNLFPFKSIRITSSYDHRHVTMRAANNESRLRIVVFPHHSCRLSHHLRTHRCILHLYIRCDEIVMELRHGDFPASCSICICTSRVAGSFLFQFLPPCLPSHVYHAAKMLASLMLSKRRKHRSFHLSRVAYLFQEASLKINTSMNHLGRTFNTCAI